VDAVNARAVADAIRAALAGRTDVKLAILFGSEARGDAGAASDVDIAVDAPAVDRLTLAADLTRALGREVDIVSLDDPGVPLLEAILRDGLPVHESAHGNFAQWRAHAWMDLETDRPGFERMRDAWLKRVAARGV
jgi:predicted nucleotidyltransferase